MAARKKKEEINLIPQKGFESSTAGRILVWILSTFRIIVIVTEIIVMTAFLSRFWLDVQNTDLNDEIRQKQAVLAASSSFENEFKQTQKKLTIFSELTKNEGVTTDLLSTIVSYLPPDLFLTSLRLKTEVIDISGATPSERSIQQLITNLLSTGKFKGVEVKELSSDRKDPNLLVFRLEALLEGGQDESELEN